MSARSAVKQAAAKAVILFGALFLVSVLLTAMPNHRAPEMQGQAPTAAQSSAEQQAPAAQQPVTALAAKHAPASASHKSK